MNLVEALNKAKNSVANDKRIRHPKINDNEWLMPFFELELIPIELVNDERWGYWDSGETKEELKSEIKKLEKENYRLLQKIEDFRRVFDKMQNIKR